MLLRKWITRDKRNRVKSHRVFLFSEKFYWSGVLQYVSRRPLLFALEHCRGCYRDYQWWLTVREPGENYVNPDYREAGDFEVEG